ncbi:E3 ubiquitin/ISG15 ligase TRIM25 [Eucyclogobius newberryi]|uniref:E3 ubiquitin/ISG15 ligase TRIM25 n=1 Tax=Eucyclogobius newberryi TaxID=166745 RepID=UPI003B5A8AE7
MASGKSSVLQEELTCPVCLDLYRDPHLLPCGHNFCKACLDRLKRQADRGRFRCPECRDSHRCSSAVQKNFKLANIADDFRLRRRQAGASGPNPREGPCPATQRARAAHAAVPCDYCPPVAGEASGGESEAGGGPGTSFAVKTCLKCEVSMCPEHVKPHLELPAFREHPLTEPMSDFWRRKCPDHDEVFRYYCMNDKVCVCNACTIEGGHSGHTIKTLKNTMKDLKVSLDKQMYRVERKSTLAEKKIQEQKEKERKNKKFMDDSDECLTRLGEDLKAKVLLFIGRLKECGLTHWDTNGPMIQKNISRIGQDQVRLQEVRSGIEGLLQENDPFRFIEAYKTTGKWCRRQLRKDLFYPEYVDMETELLGVMMDGEMRKFLDEELPCRISATIVSLCHISDLDEEEDTEEEAAEDEDEDEDDFLDDFLQDSSEEEMRSEGEEEEEEEDGQDHSDPGDNTFSPEDEDDEEEEEDEEEDEIVRRV